MAEAGNVAWDLGSYDFLLDGKDFDSIHPSLQRQALLNMEYGLYEVVPDRIYQVRGFDLASISFLRSDTGWIVFDPLTAKETAAAALALVSEHLGERPVVAVVYSHSHGDHFGGVRGVVDEADLRSGVVPVIAPVGFFQWWQVLTLVGLLLLGSFFTGVALWQFVPVSTRGRSVQHDPVADLAGTITSSPGDVISRVAMSPRGTSTRWTAWPA